MLVITQYTGNAPSARNLDDGVYVLIEHHTDQQFFLHLMTIKGDKPRIVKKIDGTLNQHLRLLQNLKKRANIKKILVANKHSNAIRAALLETQVTSTIQEITTWNAATARRGTCE